MSGYARELLTERGGVPSGWPLLKKPFQVYELLLRVGALMEQPEPTAKELAESPHIVATFWVHRFVC
jgi:hypothetical protein